MTGKTVTIGRDGESSVLLQDEEVSRLHCSLFAESSQIFLVDEGSSNGTFLNGSAITRAQVHKGDKILVGNTQFEFNSYLQLSLDPEDFSPLTASPTRVKRNSLENSLEQTKDTKHVDQSETDTDSIGFGFKPNDNSQISEFTEHRINNILQGLNGGAHLVQTGLESQDFDLCKKGWEIARLNQNRVTELVHDLLSLNSQLALEPKRCDLAEIIVGVADQLKPKLDNANLACQFPPVGETFATVDCRSIQTCLQCLLRLVIDAARGNEALLEFSILQDQQTLHLTIRYPGAPIQSSSRADPKADYCGTAQLVLRKIVGAHNGSLTFQANTSSAQTGQGKSRVDVVCQSEATLSLPLETN